MSWLLVVFIMDTQIHFEHYSTLETCEKAAVIVKSKLPRVVISDAFCIPKD